ncbi:MAG: hypothetical protein LBF84_02335 [Holosporales bacterium]|nr:hypothetical protein [Holosporales bacterium]
MGARDGPPFKGYHKKVKESLILCEYLNPLGNPEDTASPTSNIPRKPGDAPLPMAELQAVQEMRFSNTDFVQADINEMAKRCRGQEYSRMKTE